MTTFHEVRLPEDVERGAVGGLRFKTTVLPLDSGYEQRNIDWSQAKGEWDISYGLMSMDDTSLGTYISLVSAFHKARYGKAYGFRFKDWSDFKIGNPSNPTVTNQVIGTTDGIQTVWQVYKRYSSGGFNYDRTIKKLVTGTVSVLLDGVVQSSGVTVDANAGTVTFSPAPAAGKAVQIACEFDVPVRFDDDHLKINVTTLDAAQIESIPIVEIRV